jgi:hypothetical protein
MLYPDLNSVAAFAASTDGVPQDGLGRENFRIGPAEPAADSTLPVVCEVAASMLRGLYLLSLATVKSMQRRKGL